MRTVLVIGAVVLLSLYLSSDSSSRKENPELAIDTDAYRKWLSTYPLPKPSGANIRLWRIVKDDTFGVVV